ncbi:DUF6680 family protein [Algoriphagus algorifonticola]|uniref:DUF6680 family protein n=1 Tax=Algoriphagus algorifonticola TaxID=2593007 RepID=UPI0011AA4B40|nr:DUF6680 family protein [Algoriphagus algorifonticola]
MDELMYILEKIAIPLIAAFVGAVLAFRYQSTLELKRDKRLIIQTLMVYRNVGAEELDWIKALNAIDVVFNKDEEVKRLFHKFLSETRLPAYNSYAWIETFYEMVFEMAKCSDYDTLTMQNIREFYSPEALKSHYPNLNDPKKPTPPPEDSVPTSEN